MKLQDANWGMLEVSSTDSQTPETLRLVSLRSRAAAVFAMLEASVIHNLVRSGLMWLLSCPAARSLFACMVTISLSPVV